MYLEAKGGVRLPRSGVQGPTQVIHEPEPSDFPHVVLEIHQEPGQPPRVIPDVQPPDRRSLLALPLPAGPRCEYRPEGCVGDAGLEVVLDGFDRRLVE